MNNNIKSDLPVHPELRLSCLGQLANLFQFRDFSVFDKFGPANCEHKSMLGALFFIHFSSYIHFEHGNTIIHDEL
jgi:hypothetical protein